MERKIKKQPSAAGTEILINVGPVETRIAILSDGKLMDFFMEREGLEHYAGSIYKGKVTSIVKGIEAAFVDIGLEKNGFLHLRDVIDKSYVLKDVLPEEGAQIAPVGDKSNSASKIKEVLKNGQEIMVQVIKEAIGTKGARITSCVSIPGRYLVLTPHDPHIGISRRIKDRAKRKEIRDILHNIKTSDKIGWIVRTMAEDSPEKEFREEMKYLLNLWERIRTRMESNPAPTTVYEEYGAVLRMIRDRFTDDVAGLVVDSKDEYNRIMKFLKSFRPELRKKVKLYKGRTPLFEKYNLDKKIDEIFERKVGLKSGGNIVIEQTEGLVAIDVNTGRFTGKKKLEDTAYKTNLEAAAEISRQLMLRDIGGIVIIDFIDMEEKAHRDNVFNLLQQELKRDKAKISLRSISTFGVVEMTRQRMRKSLEGTSHVECPYCYGKGVVKSAETVAIETARKIDRVLSTINGMKKHVSVLTHPDINVALMSDQAKMLSDIQRRHRCKIELKEDPSLHREDVVINRG
jgi:ribonuclease G